MHPAGRGPAGTGRELTQGRRRSAVVVAAGVAAVLLAGCGSVGSGSPAPQTGQAGRQLEQALRPWSAFPVSASPRPLVLTGPGIAGPRSGFPDGPAKLAYLEGAITAPAVLPPGPAAGPATR